MTRFRNVTRQRLTLALIAVLAVGGTGLSLWLFKLLRDNHATRVSDEFVRGASERAGAIEAALRRSIAPLLAVRSFVDAADSLEQDNYSRFTQALLKDSRGIKALSFIPRVPAESRADFERVGRQTIAGFRITGRDVDGRMVPAAPRAEYFPVYFIEPLAGNERARGFDLASQTARRVALDEARDIGSVVATARIHLVQEQADLFSFLLIEPLYRNAEPPRTVAERREQLRGYVTAVIRVGDLVEQALAILKPSGIDVAVFDESARRDERLLYLHASRRRRDSNGLREVFDQRTDTLRHVWTFELANRRLSIESRAVPGVFSLATPGIAWGALVGGLAFTLLLLGYLSVLRTRAAQLSADRDDLERRVHERTAELEAAHQDLLRQERLAALGQLTGSVAHELRNPLSTVRNSIEVIDRRSEDDLVKRNLERAKRNIHRCDRIITELLDYGRARGPMLRATPVDRWLAEQLEYAVLPDEVTLACELHAGDAVVGMDPDMLAQALTNILSNACHAATGNHGANGGARVTVTSRIADGAVCIEVRDNGPGIPASELPRIREPLYSTKTFGVGLGLSIVQRIMQQHNGTFDIHSQVGEGTRAVLSLTPSAAR